MKKLVLCVLALALSLSAADVSGKWAGKAAQSDQKYGQIFSTTSLELKQSGSAVSGTLVLSNMSYPITGTNDGSTLKFSLKAGKTLVTGTFTPSANGLSGRYSTDSGQVYTVQLAKQ